MRDKLVCRLVIRVAMRYKLLARREKLVARREKLVARREKLVARREKPIARREKLEARREKLVPRREKLVARKEMLVAIGGKETERVGLLGGGGRGERSGSNFQIGITRFCSVRIRGCWWSGPGIGKYSSYWFLFMKKYIFSFIAKTRRNN
jgi:hypothetical protein